MDLEQQALSQLIASYPEDLLVSTGWILRKNAYNIEITIDAFDNSNPILIILKLYFKMFLIYHKASFRYLRQNHRFFN